MSASPRSEPEIRTLPDHYLTLGVPPTADRETLRRAFRELSKQYHPDTTTLPAAEATRKFQALQAAYRVLSDPGERQRYDLTRTPLPVVSLPNPTPVAAPIPSNAYLDAKDRALSPGELFALFLLALTFVVSLVLAIGLGLARGEALLKPPSWLESEPAITEAVPDAEPVLSATTEAPSVLTPVPSIPSESPT